MKETEAAMAKDNAINMLEVKSRQQGQKGNPFFPGIDMVGQKGDWYTTLKYQGPKCCPCPAGAK